MDRRAVFNLVWMLICVGVSGCSTVLPRTAALNEVHQVYRDEFIESQIPVPRIEQGSLAPQALAPGTFDRTVAAIGDFRRRYADAAQENNHLTVLEGMIYLQSRQIGLARLAREEVEKAGQSLTTGESAPRDALFAATFRHLIEGWDLIAREEIDRKDTQKRDEDKFVVGNRGSEDVVALTTAANGIRRELCTRREAGQLERVGGDQGATYLAATAAVFLVWADKANESMCARGLSGADCLPTRRGTPDHLRAGRDLIRSFLPPILQKAADAGMQPASSGTTPGATRYLSIMEFLSNRLKARTGTEPDRPGDACRPG